MEPNNPITFHKDTFEVILTFLPYEDIVNYRLISRKWNKYIVQSKKIFSTQYLILKYYTYMNLPIHIKKNISIIEIDTDELDEKNILIDVNNCINELVSDANLKGLVLRDFFGFNCIFPDFLEMLVYECEQPILKLPTELKSLTLGKYYSHQLPKLPDKLNYLKVGMEFNHNFIDNLPSELPNSLEYLDLSECEFVGTLQYRFPENLKVLRLGTNNYLGYFSEEFAKLNRLDICVRNGYDYISLNNDDIKYLLLNPRLNGMHYLTDNFTNNDEQDIFRDFFINVIWRIDEQENTNIGNDLPYNMSIVDEFEDPIII